MMQLVELRSAPLIVSNSGVRAICDHSRSLDDEQLQVGERRLLITGVAEMLCFFVATLSYSRRPHVRVFRHERQSAWLEGLESTLAAFGGVPTVFHARLPAFAAHWSFRPVACAPYRPRTKGKDDGGVGYEVEHYCRA